MIGRPKNQMVNNNLVSGLFKEAKQVAREEGIPALLRAILQFVIKPVYFRYHYFIAEDPLDLINNQTELAKFKPGIDINRLSFKIVRSNQEADQLENEGFEFRSYPYIHEVHLTYSQMLDCGLTAFCTFVDKDFAACSWLIPSQQVQDKFNAPPLKIDYANHEAFTRAAWTNPKYRRLGLYTYNVKNRDLYLAQNGFRKLRGTIDYRNDVGIGMSEGVGYLYCGTATYAKFLWKKTWIENYDQPGLKGNSKS
jgi:hypothetical protein